MVIASDTRLRGREAVKTFDDRPNMQAQRLRPRRTWTIFLVLPDNGTPVYSQIAPVAHARAEGRGYAPAFGRHVAQQLIARSSSGLPPR